MPKNPFLKALSLSLAFVFTVESSVWAVPDSLARHSPAGSANGIDGIEIPESLGTLQSRYFPETPVSGKPFIIHIQDAHAQPEAQRNIRAILDYLAQNKKIQKIAVEAAFGKLGPKQFEFFRDPTANGIMADHLTEMGELTGAELFAMGPGSAGVELYGIEEEAIYIESFRAFRQVKSRKQETEEVLRAYDKSLDQTEARVFSKDLWNWIKKKKEWDEKKDEALDYFRALRELAAKYLKLDLSDAANQFEWPNLTRLLKAEETESKFNRETAISQIRELSRVILRATPQGGYSVEPEGSGREVLRYAQDDAKRGFLLEGLDLLINSKPFALWLAANTAFPEIKTSRRFFELLYEEAQGLKIPLLNYPDFLTLGGLLILREELDSAGLFKELKTLEDRLESVVAKSEQEKKLLQIAKDFSILRKLAALEMSREDYEIYTARKQELAPEVFRKRVLEFSPLCEGCEKIERNPDATGYLVVKNTPRDDISDIQIDSKGRRQGEGDYPLLSQEVLALSEKFYELSRKRDRVLIENTLKSVAKDKATVLIAGGFHSEGFAEFLKSEKIPHMVITPKITHFANDGLYEKVMMGENANLEDFTATGDTLGRVLFTSLMRGPGLLKEMDIAPQQLQAVAAKVILENVIPGLSKQGKTPEEIQNVLSSFVEEHRWIFGNTRFVRLESGDYGLETGEVRPAVMAEAPVRRAEVRMSDKEIQTVLLLVGWGAFAVGAAYWQWRNKQRAVGDETRGQFNREEQKQTADFYQVSISTAPSVTDPDNPDFVVIDGGEEAAVNKAATAIQFIYPHYKIQNQTPSPDGYRVILSQLTRSEVRMPEAVSPKWNLKTNAGFFQVEQVRISVERVFVKEGSAKAQARVEFDHPTNHYWIYTPEGYQKIRPGGTLRPEPRKGDAGLENHFSLLLGENDFFYVGSDRVKSGDASDILAKFKIVKVGLFSKTLTFEAEIKKGTAVSEVIPLSFEAPGGNFPRKVNEQIRIGDQNEIVVTVVEIMNEKEPSVRIGIKADSRVPVRRAELSSLAHSVALTDMSKQSLQETPGLTLRRYLGQKVIINENIILTVLAVEGDQAVLGINAPRKIQVSAVELPPSGSEARTAPKILFADKPGKINELQALAGRQLIQIIRENEMGGGKDPVWLKQVLREEQPDVIIVRSDTKLDRAALEILAA
ncbi:MAG TPA: carbon storage regulator, partial [bacterium]|nr:carbon storage regulator [bacterium]